VYKLQRETFYLAVDMYERFMAVNNNVRKEHLQKIGVTCLFAAAKLEVTKDFTVKTSFNEHLLSTGNLSTKGVRVCICHRWCL